MADRTPQLWFVQHIPTERVRVFPATDHADINTDTKEWRRKNDPNAPTKRIGESETLPDGICVAVFSADTQEGATDFALTLYAIGMRDAMALYAPRRRIQLI